MYISLSKMKFSKITFQLKKIKVKVNGAKKRCELPYLDWKTNNKKNPDMDKLRYLVHVILIPYRGWYNPLWLLTPRKFLIICIWDTFSFVNFIWTRTPCTLVFGQILHCSKINIIWKKSRYNKKKTLHVPKSILL